MEKEYTVCFHVNDNPITYEHNDRMLVGAEDDKGILEEFKSRIEEEFDYGFSSIDLSSVQVYEGDITKTGLDNEVDIDIEGFFKEEKKIEQLAIMLGIEADEIEVSENANEFLTPEGTYSVMTEDEAKGALKDYIESFIFEEGFKYLSHEMQERALDGCFDEKEVEDYIYDDIVDELYATYDKTDYDEDFIAKFTTEAGVDIDELIDTVIENRLEALKADYSSLAQYLADEHGIDWINEALLDQTFTLDCEKLAEHHEALYDFGHLSSYDGKDELTDDNKFHVFKQSDEDERTADFLNGKETEDLEY